jgi:hypothetical protein
MKSLQFKYSFILIFSIIISCQYDKPDNLIVSFANEENIDLDLYNKITIIPAEGCRQCILEKKNNADDSILYVLTGSTLNNSKAILNYFSKDVSIVIDKNNLFSKNELVSTNPVNFIKKDNQFIKQN